METPISKLNRVGETTAKKLARLGIFTAGDLLYYFPFRYEDYSHLCLIKELAADQAVTIKGKIELIGSKRSFRRRMFITEALVADSSGSIRATWFNQPFITKLLQPGDEVFLSGTVTADALGPKFVGPAYEKVGKNFTAHTARLVPIYPLTAGITEKQIRFLTSQVMPLVDTVAEWLPAEILEKYDLAPLGAALKGTHFPADQVDLDASTERLKFDEIFLLRLRAEMAKKDQAIKKAQKIIFKEPEIKNFVANLPFTLTKTQKIAAWEILQDLEKSTPMNRLLSGDVGSGKTIVAGLAMYDTVLNDCQTALMAPTEILATQHYNSLVNYFGGTLTIGILTNSKCEIDGAKLEAKTISGQKKEFLVKLENSEIQIAVGTHALLSEGVEFKKLGLVVVDEQHRFGVEQRKIMKEKSAFALAGLRRDATHFLSMTATPIPRSLALVIYGELDISTINEMPPGRKPIITRLVEPAKRQLAYDFIRKQIKVGRQAFVICPAIENAEGDFPSANFSDKKAVLSEYEKLSKQIFPDLRVGYLHGKMTGKIGTKRVSDTVIPVRLGGGIQDLSKDEVLNQFRRGELDIIVATSVVEVGVDIPNASVMMIENADRFGLAQLHQFRGRVGRSVYQSYCLLFSDNLSLTAKDRLQYFEKNLDGFKLAEKDLEMRGPGQVYGLEQSGMMNFRLAKLTDREIIKKASDAAKEVVENIKTYPALLAKTREFEMGVHLE